MQLILAFILVQVNIQLYNQYFSDYWLFNADYFRIEYSFWNVLPKLILQKLSLKALRLYVAAENPFTIRADHRVEDFKPETASRTRR
ncbi:hypothetical protein NXX64_21630 [Bacteroides fragilis]|nr:hypothetical protein [Bacteroides fragilis]